MGCACVCYSIHKNNYYISDHDHPMGERKHKSLTCLRCKINYIIYFFKYLGYRNMWKRITDTMCSVNSRVSSCSSRTGSSRLFYWFFLPQSTLGVASRKKQN